MIRAVLLAGIHEDLQTVINIIVTVSKQFGLLPNRSKTKYKLITKTPYKWSTIEKEKEYKNLSTTSFENKTKYMLKNKINREQSWDIN